MAGNETFRAGPTNLKPTNPDNPGESLGKHPNSRNSTVSIVTKEETTQGQTKNDPANPTPKRATDRGWQRRKPETLTAEKTEARDKERQTSLNKAGPADQAAQTKAKRPKPERLDPKHPVRMSRDAAETA